MQRKAYMAAEIKALSSEGSFEGYASIFNRLDEGRDVIARGAFKKSIAARGLKGIKLLWQHDPKEPIGIIDSVREDERGLRVKGRLLLDLARAREALSLMRAGVLDGLSIGYRVKRADVDRKTGTRRLLEVELWEISFVTFPMQPDARLFSLRGEKPDTIRAFESFLRDAGGFSRKEAKALAAQGFAALTAPRDAAAHRSNPWRDVKSALERTRTLLT